MVKQKKTSGVIEDERIQSITNKYAARAFIFLAYYLFISIIIKSFTLDVNIFLYWDNAIAFAIGGFYMIYRSAEEGVPVAPVISLNILNPSFIKIFGVTSLFLGLFIIYIISGMDGRLAVLMPGVWEKMAGIIVIGVLSFLMITAIVWLMDVLPTKKAFRKASELAGEPGEELPDDEEVIKQSHVKDERIDSTIEKYAAHALYFLFGYILLSTMVKFFIPDLSMIVYYDMFLAAMAAGGYFTYNIINAGVYQEQKLSRKDQVRNWLISLTAYLALGMLMSFYVFPMADSWAALLDSTGMKIIFGLLMAVFFGIGMYLIGKATDWYASNRADELMESD